ncbi:MAG: hypothetical protein COA49_06860 [Bacteroidetes bacterium]|nr:MAG: hypothetical protein COA49_06860 [Bacteroidota bacterium]
MRYFIIIIIALSSCSTSIIVESTSSRRPYDYESTPLHPEITPYRHGDSISVYLTLDRKELLYTRESENTPFTSSLNIKMNKNEWIINDTLSTTSSRWILKKFEISAYKYRDSDELSKKLKVTVLDGNRNSSVEDVLDISEILIWDIEENWPISGGNASIGTRIKILSDNESKWEVKSVVPKKTMPAPPYSGYRNPLDTITAKHYSTIDSMWTVIDGTQSFISLTSDLRWVLHSRPKDFPEVKDVRKLIEATRYIATRSEYSEMNNASQPKEALDEFWLACGKSPERTKELIKTYYLRVEEANRAFSGLQEGWRTDRGMVHIIMGVPTRIRRDYWNEYWTYGEDGTTNSLTLRFRRRSHELDNNRFRLERNIIYRTTWDRMVTNWRNGRVQRD